MIFRLLLCSFLYYGGFCQNESLFRLRGTDRAKKCKTYAGVTGSAVYEYETNICYICEIPPHNNTYNTVTKLCSNGETSFIYFGIHIL